MWGLYCADTEEEGKGENEDEDSHTFPETISPWFHRPSSTH